MNKVEINVHNALTRNKEHVNCSLILKASYKNAYNYALYCSDHDHFLCWASYDDFNDYKKLGVNKVEYTDSDNYLGACIIPSNNWAFEGHTSSGLTKTKTTKVTNYKTGKKTEIWVAFKGNKQRDPSMPEYWKFIEKLQKG